MSAQPEVWRVSTVEGIFETDLETLKQWILEGCVLPTDKVSKGNLSWCDAGLVPKLKGAFNGDTRPAPKPVNNSFEAFVAANPEFNRPQTVPTTSLVPATVYVEPPADSCHDHPQAEPEYVCRQRGEVFCKDCPNLVKGVAVCPSCGDLCRKFQQVSEQAARAELQASGFGMEDFLRAIRYPLEHKAALICGALIYGFLLLAGFRGALVAWMVMFGCISHVISQVAWGRLNRSFMPDFSSFSLWDDLVVPVFLGVGIMIVTWGPIIALVLALMFGVLSGGTVNQTSLPESAPASEQFTQEDLAVLSDPEADPRKLEEANRKLQQLRPGAEMARQAEKSTAEENDPSGFARHLLPYLGAGASLFLLFVLFLLWALFYYPMALTVAGYTQSFGSVINPIVGLDTIRRMGSTYFKAFGMVILVQFVAFIVGAGISIITSPLTIPFMGNMVGNFIDATFTFYFNLVIACILGLSLFKCADRLGINVD